VYECDTCRCAASQTPHGRALHSLSFLPLQPTVLLSCFELAASWLLCCLFLWMRPQRRKTTNSPSVDRDILTLNALCDQPVSLSYSKAQTTRKLRKTLRSRIRQAPRLRQLAKLREQMSGIGVGEECSAYTRTHHIGACGDCEGEIPLPPYVTGDYV